MISLNSISQSLSDHKPEVFTPDTDTRQAAVAIILSPLNAKETRMLFIKRSEKPGDPWSGHMAFPGGHKEVSDTDLCDAAIRETSEEIGLQLSRAQCIGALDQQRANPRGRELNMLIAPYVFELHTDPVFNPNYEVDEVVWASVKDLYGGGLHDTETKPMAGKPTVFNGYRLHRGHFVWGLTYRMLQTFFTTIDTDWQAPPEID